MPTYEYACQACENQWEIEQRITEPALTDCPKCGQPEARRLISGSRFVLKGGGWYADGYGSKSPPASSKTEGESKKAEGESKKAEPAKTGGSTPAASAPTSTPSSSS